MAIGSIISFPISTIYEFATSAQLGLCPQLSATVSTLALANKNMVPSEQAVREALDTISTDVDVRNLGYGFGIYSNKVGDTSIFNRIYVDGTYSTGYVSSGTLCISGFAGSSGLTPVTGASGFSVQGGKYQYTNTFDASAIQYSGTTIASGAIDDVIGKIFIKCFVPFENTGSQYSIGYDGVKERYVLKFNAPLTQGLYEDWYYSSAMSGEYDWLSQDKVLKIYSYGTPATSGQLGISIFYDKAIWQPEYGYWMGTSTTQIGKLNFSIDGSSYSTRGTNILYNTESNYATASNNYYIYVAGGMGAGNTPNYNDINRLDTKNDTASVLDRGNLTTGRYNAGCGKSSTKLYFYGGAYYSPQTQSAIIDNIQFANDTANAVHNANLATARRASANGIENTTSMWIAGGYNGSNVTSNAIERMDFASDTSTTTIAATLTTARYNERSAGWNTTLNGYVLPGVRNTGGSYYNANELSILSKTTETVTTMSSFLSITSREGSTTQSTTYGYFYNTKYQNSTTSTDTIDVNTLFRMNFSNSTVEILYQSTDFVGNGASV